MNKLLYLMICAGYGGSDHCKIKLHNRLMNADCVFFSAMSLPPYSAWITKKHLALK